MGRKDDRGNPIIEACPVENGIKTSSSALLHFLDGISWADLKILTIEQRTKNIGSATICLCYQHEENGYHARSFEDAFIHINHGFINSKKVFFKGLKNKMLFDNRENNAYKLANLCIKKKTHFALDILYNSDSKFTFWEIPSYIKNGLLWLKED